MINIENMSYGYKKNENIYNNFSFNAEEGESWGIVGFNGAGKSTLIKIILGIIKPKTGTIKLVQKDVYKERKKIMNDIGVVWGQKPTLWWDIPVYDSFLMLKKIYKISNSTFESRISYLNTNLGVSDYWKQPLRTLSLGQRVKAEIMASLLHAPKILIYDEPFIGLDFLTRKKIIELLKQYRSENRCTLLLTSHNIMDINELCNNLLLINSGNILYNGGIEQIKERYYNLRKLNVFYKNEKFELTDKVKDCITVIEKKENKVQILFDTKTITYQDVMSDLLTCNDIIEFDNDDNVLEQLIENIILKEEQK